MANSALGKTDRFYQNPILRDAEWNRAKQAPWWLMTLAVAIIAIAFAVGVYGGPPNSTIGWVVGIATIAIYLGLEEQRRRRARQHLRQVHGQPLS